MTQDKLTKIANKLLRNQEQLDEIICDLVDESFNKEYRQALYQIARAVTSLGYAEKSLLALIEEMPFKGREYLPEPKPQLAPLDEVSGNTYVPPPAERQGDSPYGSFPRPKGYDLEGKLVGQAFGGMIAKEAAASARLDRDEQGRPMTRYEGDGYDGQEKQDPRNPGGYMSGFIPYSRL